MQLEIRMHNDVSKLTLRLSLTAGAAAASGASSGVSAVSASGAAALHSCIRLAAVTLENARMNGSGRAERAAALLPCVPGFTTLLLRACMFIALCWCCEVNRLQKERNKETSEQRCTGYRPGTTIAQPVQGRPASRLAAEDNSWKVRLMRFSASMIAFTMRWVTLSCRNYRTEPTSDAALHTPLQQSASNRMQLPVAPQAIQAHRILHVSIDTYHLSREL